MAIKGIEQPEIIQINDTLLLRKYDGVFDFALEWYQDEDTEGELVDFFHREIRRLEELM